MGWLSKKTSSDTTGNPVKKGVLWLETASEDAYKHALNKLWVEVRDLPRYPDDRNKQNANVFSAALMSRMQKLDRTLMTKSQRTELAKLIFVTIPQKINRLETQLLDYEQKWDAVDDFGAFVKTTLTRQIDPMPRKLPINQTIAPKPEAAKKAIEKVGDKESDAKLTRVKELAHAAYKTATTVDDRFFAEQAINSYIPECVRILTGLINAPEDMKKEANEIFHRQLDIIQKQLDIILHKETSGSLAEMKAHMEFLESKNNQLNLKKNKTF